MKKKSLVIVFISTSCVLVAQNIGIGTITPVGRLHIKGNSDTTQLLIDAHVSQSNSKPLIKLRNSNGAELLRIHADDTSNVFIGRNAGSVNAIDLAYNGYANTFIGSNAAASNTRGNFNTAIGYFTLLSNTIGNQNTANGAYALYANTLGNYNTAIGSNALHSNTTSNENTAVGANALYLQSFKNNGNSWNGNNVAIGYGALANNSPQSVSTGMNNTGVGHSALFSNGTGHHNTATGQDALSNNTTGSYNTAIGQNALFYNSGGNDNISIGYNSGNAPASPNIFNTVSIGNSGWYNGFQNQVFIGNAGTGWIGGWKPWSVYSDGRLKKNIVEDVNGLSFIKKLRPVTYEFLPEQELIVLTGNSVPNDFKKQTLAVKPTRQTGFIAQEVIAAAQESGYTFSGISKVRSGEEMYSISYESFVVPLVKAMQEQQVMIEALKKPHSTEQTANNTLLEKQQATIMQLLFQIKMLEKRVAALEAKK
jgi:trimeric autotransporter adhesin